MPGTLLLATRARSVRTNARVNEQVERPDAPARPPARQALLTEVRRLQSEVQRLRNAGTSGVLRPAAKPPPSQQQQQQQQQYYQHQLQHQLQQHQLQQHQHQQQSAAAHACAQALQQQVAAARQQAAASAQLHHAAHDAILQASRAEVSGGGWAAPSAFEQPSSAEMQPSPYAAAATAAAAAASRAHAAQLQAAAAAPPPVPSSVPLTPAPLPTLPSTCDGLSSSALLARMHSRGGAVANELAAAAAAHSAAQAHTLNGSSPVAAQRGAVHASVDPRMAAHPSPSELPAPSSLYTGSGSGAVGGHAEYGGGGISAARSLPPAAALGLAAVTPGMMSLGLAENQLGGLGGLGGQGGEEGLDQLVSGLLATPCIRRRLDKLYGKALPPGAPAALLGAHQ